MSATVGCIVTSSVGVLYRKMGIPLKDQTANSSLWGVNGKRKRKWSGQMETTEGEQMGKSSVFSHASSVVHTVLLLYYVLYLQTHPLVVVLTDCG